MLQNFIEDGGNMHMGEEKINDSAIIECKDCQVYETNLQKLEGEVRQHIRV